MATHPSHSAPLTAEAVDTSRFEQVAGSLVERPLPTLSHSDIQFRITSLLRVAGQPSSMRANQEVSLDQSADPTSDWLTPDVLVSLPEGFTLKPNGHVLPPAHLAVEVLSPGQSFFNMRSKVACYLDWGVQHVWLIDPDSSTALVFDAKHPGSGQLVFDGDLRAGDLALPLSEILVRENSL
jgi:Uma2 family endonuclease